MAQQLSFLLVVVAGVDVPFHWESHFLYIKLSGALSSLRELPHNGHSLLELGATFKQRVFPTSWNICNSISLRIRLKLVIFERWITGTSALSTFFQENFLTRFLSLKFGDRIRQCYGLSQPGITAAWQSLLLVRPVSGDRFHHVNANKI